MRNKTAYLTAGGPEPGWRDRCVASHPAGTHAGLWCALPPKQKPRIGSLEREAIHSGVQAVREASGRSDFLVI